MERKIKVSNHSSSSFNTPFSVITNLGDVVLSVVPRTFEDIKIE
jgi:hypothetical protein